MVHNGRAMPSTTIVNGKLSIRPCFVGARTSWRQAEELVEEIIAAGERVVATVQPMTTANNNRARPYKRSQMITEERNNG